MKTISRKPLLTLALFLLASTLNAQDASDNPFAGFETHILPNGLKVWYKCMPGQANAALNVTVEVGSGSDPRGKEQMAHFLEHMQFSDHLGLSTQEIKKQIDDRGGVFNGTTGADRTSYFVRVKKDHAVFALEWLYRVISPHEMKPEVVERERSPVEVEVGARPREVFDWIAALYLNPPYLRMPGIWSREFGLDALEFRDAYLYRSLRSITPGELRQFYDRHYVPLRMTLTVIGDIDRAAVLNSVGKTFATLQQLQEPPSPDVAKDAGRSRSTFSWVSRPNISHARRIRFASLTARDEVTLTFISSFLGKRLNDRLRFGERKAVYGVSTGLAKFGPAGYFSIGGTIREPEFTFARDVIEEEIEALRSGSHSDAIFEAERNVLVQQLRVSNSTPEALESWARSNFGNRERHRDFPDVLSAFQEISKADLARFTSEHFVPEREFNTTTYPLPVSQGTMLILGIGLTVATVKLMRRIMTRPVDMRRIRYVAHFRVPRAMYIAAGAMWIIVIAVGLRLLVFGYEAFNDAFLLTRNSILVQWSAYALMAASVIAVLVLGLSLVPSKVLVFEDHLRIKYVAYRSVPISFKDVVDISFQRFPSVWLSARLWKCAPFKLGLLSPGIYLKQRNGWSYFFDVRDRKELVESVMRPPESVPEP